MTLISRYSFKRFSVTLAFLSIVFLGSAAFAEYTVVMLSSGKVIKGELVSESDELVILRVEGVNVQFKKNQLDLEKMKSLNQGQQPTKAPAKMQENTIQEKTITNFSLPPDKKQQNIPLAELAKKTNQERTGNSKLLTEGDSPCSSGSEFSEGPDSHSVADVKYYEEEIAKLEYQYQIVGETIDPNDKRLVSLRNKLAWARQEVEEGQSALDRHEQQKKAHQLQNDIKEAERHVQLFRESGDLKSAEEQENLSKGYRKELEEVDAKIQSMTNKQPCSGVQNQKAEQIKSPADSKPPVNKPVETKKSNARVFTEADIKPQDEEMPEEYLDLTAEQKAKLIEKTNEDIEWLERHINQIRENGGSDVLIQESEKELKEAKKKLRFLTGE